MVVMTPLTLDLPPEMRARLSAEAKRRHVSESAFVQAIVAEALAGAEVFVPADDGAAAASGVSCLDLAGDLIGSVRSGKLDLATNPQYLEEAIARDATRWKGDA